MTTTLIIEIFKWIGVIACMVVAITATLWLICQCCMIIAITLYECAKEVRKSLPNHDPYEHLYKNKKDEYF